jgi:hypothetical protein
MPENTLFTLRTEEDGKSPFDPAFPLWNGEYKIAIDRFSSGKHALAEKGYAWTNLTEVSSAWNNSAVFFYFECWHSQDLASDLEPETATLLLRPEGCESCFRVSIDSGGKQDSAHILKGVVDIDRNWNAEAEIRVARLESERIWRAFVRLPYTPMIGSGRFPEIGDAWRLNLHRTAGPEESREFLSWRPEYTAKAGSFLSGHLIFLGAP